MTDETSDIGRHHLAEARRRLLRRTARVIAWVWIPLFLLATMNYAAARDVRALSSAGLLVLFALLAWMLGHVSDARQGRAVIVFFLAAQCGVLAAMLSNGVQVANVTIAIVLVMWATAFFGTKGLAASTISLASELLVIAWVGDWQLQPATIPGALPISSALRIIGFVLTGGLIAGYILRSASEAYDGALAGERAAWKARADERIARIVAEQSAEVLQRRQLTSSLAGGLAHDLGNALQATAMNAELLRESELSAEDQDSVQQIIAAAARARALVRDLLAFGRSVGSHEGDFGATEAMERLRIMLRGTVPVAVRVTYSCSSTARLLGDELRFGQVVMNLVVNATHAMPKGGELRVSITDLDEGHAGIQVKDTGHGIPAAIIGQVFEPFFTTRSAQEGSGLGLSMVKRIVEDLGGSISVASTEGVGTTVDVVWPVAPEPTRLS